MKNNGLDIAGGLAVLLIALAGCPNPDTEAAKSEDDLSKENAAPLTDRWADYSLGFTSEGQWFRFTATAGTQYLHVSFGTLTYLDVQLYDSADNTDFSLSSRYYGSIMSKSLTVTRGQTYYIRVTSYGSGTYKIAFNDTEWPPGVTELTADTWADGVIAINGEQWFRFTATADSPGASDLRQYLHVTFDSLTNLYVQLYDTKGGALGKPIHLSGTTGDSEYTLLTVAKGKDYYLKITPYGSYSSGAYRIAFNTVSLPLDTAAELTADMWTNRTITASNSEQWFKFTATADTQYLHVSFSTLTHLYVRLYSNSGAIGNAINLSGKTGYSEYTSLTVAKGQTYYLKVTPYDSSYPRIYKIAFNTAKLPPGVTNTAVTLTKNRWSDGSLSWSSPVQWFKFTATADTQYLYVEHGTLPSLYVQLYDSSGNALREALYFNGSTESTFLTVAKDQTYYLKITPYSSSYSGSYKIAFNTAIWTPNEIPSAETLTADTWADGSISASSEGQWFKFTATAGTQYLHVSFGTLTNLYVQLYDSAGNTLENSIHLSGSTVDTPPLSVDIDHTYYVRVTPSGSGSYKIAFNASATAP